MANTNKTLNISNNLVENGNVEICLEKNGKTFNKVVKHNSATDELCKYVAKALYGEYIIPSKPGLLKIAKLNSSGEPEPINNTPFFPLVSSSVDNKTLSLTFKLPYDILKGIKLNGFILYSESSTNSNAVCYAKVKLDSEWSIPENTNVKITWKLEVSPV